MNAIALLNEIFIYSLEKQASDIHFLLEPEGCLIRVRIHGDLSLFKSLSNEDGAQLLSRLKVLTKINSNERELPLDGHAKHQFSGYETDLRVAWMPTNKGETMTVRLLKNVEEMASLEDLGMEEEAFQITKDIIAKREGLLVMSGATGSGKTTTLHAILKEINQATNKIITIEDPVEYIAKGVTQIQVNQRLSFAVALRAALRHDPDVLLVGEIRDEETANIAVQAALTGHLVLATLHANSVFEVPLRLQSLGVQEFKIEAALKLALSQRLLKEICVVCRGKGCQECMHGTQGRRALFSFYDYIGRRHKSFAETYKIMLNKGKILRGEFFEENVYIST